MRKTILFILFLLIIQTLAAQVTDSIRNEKHEVLPRWTFYVPGASYYYQKNYLKGAAFAAHMWYDAVLMLGSFLINPEENFLGMNIMLRIN
mgnify:CR=1 FL=1